ncbi:hypothetical protein QFC19_002739 [Naganishia cerealis]|uniref:Uncharacterized protein n=1 Tax=Naganishia cerealis TaxID=610337 RepID=A0ACC2W8S0_9TREE|nr:hypothetical protein QFC19_002739 [Naganishia cerealis]
MKRSSRSIHVSDFPRNDVIVAPGPARRTPSFTVRKRSRLRRLCPILRDIPRLFSLFSSAPSQPSDFEKATLPPRHYQGDGHASRGIGLEEMPHCSNHAVSSTSRAALSTLTCLRTFPRHRKHTLTAHHTRPESPFPRTVSRGYHGLAAGRNSLTTGLVPGVNRGFEGRRWANSAAAVVVREEEVSEESTTSTPHRHGEPAPGSRGSGFRAAQRVLTENSVLNDSYLTHRLVQESLSALDAQISNESTEKPRRNAARATQPSRHTSSSDFSSPPPTTLRPIHSHHPPSQTHNSRTAPEPESVTLAKAESSTSPSSTDPQVNEILWDTESILDQALSKPLNQDHRTSGFRNTQGGEATRSLPWPTRHLRLRTVRPVDVEYAENAFHQARQRLVQLESRRDPSLPGGDPVHRDVLLAHINYMLYLSARIPSVQVYSRIKAYLREYNLEPDSHTYLSRLILLDKMNQLNQLPAVCRSFNKQRVTPPSEEGQGRSTGEKRGKTIDGDNATILLNMTIWMLAKRGHWSIVGPAYNNLLSHTSHATKHPSSAFPPDYFTPSHDLSLSQYFLSWASLDKVTYQSLIRALAFHGNIVPALAVMQDMLNDSREYTVAISDFISLFQGFARFGTIPIGWEAMVDSSAGTAAGTGGIRLKKEEHVDTMRSLRPDVEEDDGDVEYTSSRTDGSGPSSTTREMFPPPIFPEPLHPGPACTDRPSSKMDALKQMTDIWAGKVDTWDQHDGSAGVEEEQRTTMSGPTKLEREWTLVTLQQVFQSFLATSPGLDPSTSSASPSTTRQPHATSSTRHIKKYWESSLSEAPSPRNVYYIMLAFARTTDRNRPVLRAVWEHLESKFGEGNEEGWTSWRMDARLKRLRDWLAVDK